MKWIGTKCRWMWGMLVGLYVWWNCGQFAYTIYVVCVVESCEIPNCFFYFYYYPIPIPKSPTYTSLLYFSFNPNLIILFYPCRYEIEVLTWLLCVDCSIWLNLIVVASHNMSILNVWWYDWFHNGSLVWRMWYIRLNDWFCTIWIIFILCLDWLITILLMYDTLFVCWAKGMISNQPNNVLLSYHPNEEFKGRWINDRPQFIKLSKRRIVLDCYSHHPLLSEPNEAYGVFVIFQKKDCCGGKGTPTGT